MGRYLISAVLGAIVTVALAYLMQALIFSDEVLVVDADPVPTIEFTRLIRDDPPIETGLVPPSDPPPPPPTMTRTVQTDAPVIEFVVPTPATLAPIDNNFRLVTSLTPTVRVLPDYPMRQLALGREGYVVIRFEVNAQGLTQNHQVVMSEPPRIFDNAALRSVQQWRYQPQTDSEGNPITVGGQEATIRFQMDGDEEIDQ